jgi:hypothetical protein
MAINKIVYIFKDRNYFFSLIFVLLLERIAKNKKIWNPKIYYRSLDLNEYKESGFR